MALDPGTVTAILSLLPNILEQANKTIDRFKNRKAPASNAADGMVSLEVRVQELEAAAMRNAETIKLLAEQSAQTIEALRSEADRLQRQLRWLRWASALTFLSAMAALTLFFWKLA